MYMLVSLGIFLVVLVALFVLRSKLGLFLSSSGFLVSTLVFLKWGIDPPMPGAIVVLFGGMTALCVILYVTSSDEAQEAFWSPFRRTMVEPERRPLLGVLLVLVPGIIAWQTHATMLPSDTPPPRIRSVHPSPPSTMPFHGVGDAEEIEMDLLGIDSPVGKLKESDPEAYAEHVARGKVVYYENCYFCHGDTMAADGHYADAFKPPPADFTDPGTIAMLQEGFLFWRVAKGGPGLPNEGTPWDSSMPVWEDFLGEEDIWNVIAFLYDYTGFVPRGRDVLHGADDESHGDAE